MPLSFFSSQRMSCCVGIETHAHIVMHIFSSFVPWVSYHHMNLQKWNIYFAPQGRVKFWKGALLKILLNHACKFILYVQKIINIMVQGNITLFCPNRFVYVQNVKLLFSKIHHEVSNFWQNQFHVFTKFQVLCLWQSLQLMFK